MSRFFGKSRDKEKTHKFYVEFLGWIECRGLRGEQYTRPVVDDLRKKQQKWKNAPKLTLQVSKSELKISQDIVEEKKKKKIRTIKFPIIPSRDITYVTQARNQRTGQPEDIVACIYLGFVPRTKRYVHVHVYRFDTAETATKYVKILSDIVNVNVSRLQDIEMGLVNRGEIDDPRMIHDKVIMRRDSPRDPGLGSSDGMSETRTDSVPDSTGSTYSGNSIPSDEIEPDLISLKDQMPFDSITDELKQRLSMTKKEGTPLLLPPKDYDTISRKQGNLEKVDIRRSLNTSIVGNGMWTPRTRNGSDESGIELDFPSPSEEDKLAEFSIGNIENSPPTSARSMRDDCIYPPQSARSPRVSHSGMIRQPSFSSAYSSHSYRSGTSSNSNSVADLGQMYTGRRDDAFEIPPADYDAHAPVLRRENSWQGVPSNSSMQVNMFPNDVPEYAVINKRRTVSTNMPPQSIYSTGSQDHLLRRHHSMYK